MDATRMSPLRRLIAAVAVAALGLSVACQATAPVSTGAARVSAGAAPGAEQQAAPAPESGSRDAMLTVNVEVDPSVLQPSSAYRNQAVGAKPPKRPVPPPRPKPSFTPPPVRRTPPPKVRPTPPPFVRPSLRPTIPPNRKPTPRPTPSVRPTSRPPVKPSVPPQVVAAQKAQQEKAKGQAAQAAARAKQTKPTVFRSPPPSPPPKPPAFSAKPRPSGSPPPKVVMTIYKEVNGKLVPHKQITKPAPPNGGQVQFNVSGLKPGQNYQIKTSVLASDRKVTASAKKEVVPQKGQNTLNTKPTFATGPNDPGSLGTAPKAFKATYSATGSTVRTSFKVTGKVTFNVTAGSTTAGCGPQYSLKYGFYDNATKGPVLNYQATGKFSVVPPSATTLYVESMVFGNATAGGSCSSRGANTVLTIEKVGAVDVVAY